MKTEKELAFLRDLSVAADWTKRFADLADKRLKPIEKGKFLYYNAGTLAHALELREKFDNEYVEMTVVSDNEEIRKIAQAKAAAVSVKISFKNADEIPAETFDACLADFTLVKPKDLANELKKIVSLVKKGGKVAFFLPTAGSFGEIFSFLWEDFLESDLLDKGAEIERLINEIPTATNVEKMARKAGLKEIDRDISNEVFEYETGKEFIASSLISDFFFPVWLDFLSEKERQRITKKLPVIIDNNQDGLTFRFSVKATLVEGEKK